MKALPLAVTLMAIGASSVHANCVQPGNLADEFKISTVVFSGTLVSAMRKPWPIYNNGRRIPGYFVEYANFKVDKNWKGTQPGQIVHFKTPNDESGMNVRNDPKNFVAKRLRNSLKTDPLPELRISKRWLIFAGGKPPYRLSNCTHTLPMNFIHDEKMQKVIAELDKLASPPVQLKTP